jgi:solute carrier family 35, member F1/2
VRKRPLYEVVGQLGMWGFLICGTQAAALEHEAMRNASWNGGTVGLFIAYTAGTFFTQFLLDTTEFMIYSNVDSVHHCANALSYGIIDVLQPLAAFQ